MVQTGTEERRDALDAHLWTFRDDSFLPMAPIAKRIRDDQPVLLTTGEAIRNGAEIRFLVDGAEPPDLAGYERAVFLFDGHDTGQLEGARRHWNGAEGGRPCRHLLAADPGGAGSARPDRRAATGRG